MSGFNVRGEVNVQVLCLQSPDGRHEVPIHALRVDGRPVPLAGFRKIPRESIIDEITGTLKGEPLGRVNYFWGECARRKGSGHLHVVWLADGEVRVACVDRDPPAHADAAQWKARYE